MIDLHNTTTTKEAFVNLKDFIWHVFKFVALIHKEKYNNLFGTEVYVQ